MQTKCSSLFSSRSYTVDASGPIVVADHLKSPENMGHIIRLASNFGCAKVLFVGDPAEVRQRKIKKVAGAAAGQVSWQFCNDSDWRDYVPHGYIICGIETTDNSANLSACVLPKNVVFVLGNEIRGLSAPMMEQCSRFYHIPMIGVIKSMNVSQACAVALYEWLSQYCVSRS